MIFIGVKLENSIVTIIFIVPGMMVFILLIDLLGKTETDLVVSFIEKYIRKNRYSKSMKDQRFLYLDKRVVSVFLVSKENAKDTEYFDFRIKKDELPRDQLLEIANNLLTTIFTRIALPNGNYLVFRRNLYR